MASSIADTKVRDFLTSLRQEPLKLFRVYDAQNRVSIQYEAVTHAKDQDPCMKTVYQYDALSTRVLKCRESVDTWLAAYD